MTSLELERILSGTDSQIKIKKCWSPAKRVYIFGSFSIVDIPEPFCIREVLSIPIPFLDRDIGFMKFEGKWSFHWRK